MELLVVGIPGPWLPKAMETFMVLTFYFLFKGRMKFKPAPSSCYQQHGQLGALLELPPPSLFKNPCPMGFSSTCWFPRHGFDRGVKGGVTHHKSDCFHFVQAQRALMQRWMSAQQSCDTK